MISLWLVAGAEPSARGSQIRDDTSNGPAPATAQSVEKMRDDLNALQSIVQKLTGDLEAERLRTRSIAEDSDATQKDDTKISAPQSLESMLAEDERKKAHFAARIAFLNEQLAIEPIDPTWSQSANIALQEAYKPHALEGVEFTAECKTTFCRVEYTFDPVSAFAEVGARSMMMDAPWRSKGFTRFNQEDGTATLYLAREEHRLPLFQEMGPGTP